MIIKEKLIFWPLLTALIVSFGIGFYSQDKKKADTDDFMKDIEIATEKARVKKKAFKDIWDIAVLTSEDSLDNYEGLLKRNIFGRIVTESDVKKEEVIPLEEGPKKPAFIYKGRIMLGSKVMVIIEDEGTGKSYSVQEGGLVGDYVVLMVGEKDVLLKNKDGEEILLQTVKKEEPAQEKKEDAQEKKEGSE